MSDGEYSPSDLLMELIGDGGMEAHDIRNELMHNAWYAANIEMIRRVLDVIEATPEQVDAMYEALKGEMAQFPLLQADIVVMTKPLADAIDEFLDSPAETGTQRSRLQKTITPWAAPDADVISDVRGFMGQAYDSGEGTFT